ncbi:hypothetical protein [Saccharothrix xinjiangensis]|uniref:Head-to-tail stopper n=1 Tax=Saccharothrix xinjiangensis TaxID=204798 RepID=A0ABV9XWQ3_9PSEU
MYAVATCTGSIYRGTTTDDVGDTVDVDVDTATPVATRVLARIKTRTVQLRDQTTQNPITVRRPVAEMQSDTDIRPGDRYRCTRHRDTYVVLSATQPDQLGRESDLIVQLQQVTPAE